jgi:Tfp pilus assembly protein PilO
MPKIFVIGVCLFLTIVLGIFLLWPKYQDLSELKLEIFKKKLEIQSQEDYLLNLQEASRKLEERQNVLAKIDSALPPDSSLPVLFNFFQKASSESGLVLGDFGKIAISPEEKLSPREITLNLFLSGPYPAFKNFLYALENSARLIEVENISFSTPLEEDIFSFQLGIKVHSY